MENASELHETGVLVTGLSAAATAETVSDFFSFCGRITSLSLRKAESDDAAAGDQEAVVLFESESAAKTSLLLSNAVVVDKAIQVRPALKSDIASVEGDAVSGDKLTQKEFDVDDASRSKTSVVASLLAAGYTMGEGTLAKAREVDEKSGISLTLGVAVESAKAKVNAIDAQLGVSSTVNAASTVLGGKLKQWDSALGLSKNVNAAYTVTRDTTAALATQARDRAMSNPTVASAADRVSAGASATSKAVNDTIATIKSETNEEIAKRHSAEALATNAEGAEGAAAAHANNAEGDAPPAPSKGEEEAAAAPATAEAVKNES